MAISISANGLLYLYEAAQLYALKCVIKSLINRCKHDLHFLAGFVLVPAYGFGAILGGILVKRLGLQAMGSTKMSMICSISCCLLAISFIFLGCQNQPIAGITTGYQNQR